MHFRDTDVVKYMAVIDEGPTAPSAGTREAAGASTRERVRSLLLALGPSTAATLGERLGLSPAAVRKHLDALLADGTVSTRSQHVRGSRGRGRPARLYALTDAGHAGGPAAYDDLAAGALRFLAEAAGESAVERFAQARVAELEARYAPQLTATAPAERPAALAAALSADGYAATSSPHGTGVQLCQHHCPVQHVAAEFPQLCDAETAALGRLLDVHVQRLATIAHGDGVCTTYIPATPATPAIAKADR
jgi:predicted ArsR family transcriptional regulator